MVVNGCYYAEKTADKMFEKLGFKEIQDTRDIRYLKQYTFNNGNRRNSKSRSKILLAR